MRVVLLTRWFPHQIQAANRLHREFGLTAAYFEGGVGDQDRDQSTGLLRKLSAGVKTLAHPQQAYWQLRRAVQHAHVASCTHGTVSRGYSRRVYRRLFTDPWDRLVDPRLPVVAANAKRFDADDIRRWDPHVLVVFGTSILPREVYSIPSRACLNVHWGVSPFYRGSRCTDWAILNGDLENVGVTIHTLDDGIDSGAILAQERPHIEPSDTPFSIDMKLGVLGVDLVLEVLSHLRDGRSLLARPQVLSAGRTYFLKQWTGKTERALAGALRRGRVAPLLSARPDDGARRYPTSRLTVVRPAVDGRAIVLGPPFPEPHTSGSGD